MSQLVEGLAAILKDEDVDYADFAGVGFGACVAQCFVHAYPGAVRKLALASEIVPEKSRVAALKCRNTLLNWLPLSLLRHLERRFLFRHLLALPKTEGEFWRGYFTDLVDGQVTRERLHMRNDCLIDFHENYSLPPRDVIDGSPRVAPELDNRRERVYMALSE
jgi:pimeloyl-ACP methyl ester carboxylesterase